MKVYISVDIEGITGVTNWNETTLKHPEHGWAANQMDKETIAACEGALAAGVKEIYIKDAHDSARNIDLSKLPEEAILIRGWTSTPESMMAGIDESFDACVLIGYHSASGEDGNPLAHTFNNSSVSHIKLNGKLVSEFTLNSYVAAHYNVPVVFLSGDKMICESAKKVVPAIETVAVKEGLAGATFNINPDLSCKYISEGVKKAILNKENCKIELPEEFKLEIRYKEHMNAHRASFYPGARKVDAHTVEYVAKDVLEMSIARMFLL